MSKDRNFTISLNQGKPKRRCFSQGVKMDAHGFAFRIPTLFTGTIRLNLVSTSFSSEDADFVLTFSQGVLISEIPESAPFKVNRTFLVMIGSDFTGDVGVSVSPTSQERNTARCAAFPKLLPQGAVPPPPPALPSPKDKPS